MSSGKSEDFELDDSFDEESSGDFDNEDVNKSNNVKNSLTKRRVIDDILEERRLQRKIKEFDYDLDDDDETDV
ncbi:MAG: hypothetical protein KBF23_07340 [Agitococcus sp.]|jgi:hypothetical protein|nr:hypothetical protein [Moraxellaceae bacterium]MBP9216968.1 hypothetical protein [Agitococcus sp.]MBK7299958.1 hypothetical protein [Moraxellaceae bacterium]MBK8325811.1 hypothetical protein [Moraxellaceae bacterium]MBK9186238.1 hypothetical protein [Moraxellaceae bacterium]